MPASASAAPEPPADPNATDGPSWESTLRTATLIVVALVMVWLAFNVRLPDLDVLRARIEAFGWWSWLVFIGAYGVVALTPIPVTIMALTAGVLFGVVEGSVLSVIGSMLGSIGAYWIARGLGRQTVLRLLGSYGPKLENQLASAGFAAVFALRVLPGMPYWPLNYGAGALGVAQRDYVVASLVASIPGQVSLVAIGAFAARPSVVMGVVVVAAWAVVLVFSVWAWRAWRGTSSHALPGASPR